MASVKKTFTSKGEVRYRARWRDAEGKQREKRFRRKADADRFARNIETDIDRHEYFDPNKGRITVTDWSERWLHTQVHLKPKTREGYVGLLRTYVLPQFGHRRLAQVEAMEVRGWVAELSARLSPSRVRQAYRVLSSMYRLAVETRQVRTTPCSGVNLPRLPKTEVRPLSPAEIHNLAKAMGPPYDNLIYLLGFTGVRWGEAVAVRRGRCHLDRSEIEVRESASRANGRVYYTLPKTHQVRTIVVPGFLSQRLMEHLGDRVPDDPETLLFTSPRGKTLNYQNFLRRSWRPSTVAAGLEGALIHHLRHSFISMMIQSGASELDIMKQVGHEDITTTYNTYGSLFPARQERLAALLDDLYGGGATSDVGQLWGSQLVAKN